MESPPIYGNGPDNQTYFEHLSRLEKSIETASYCKSDLTHGITLATNGVTRNPKNVTKRTIFVISDMKKSNFSSVDVGTIKEQFSAWKINIHIVSETGMKEHRTRVLEQYCSVLFCRTQNRTEHKNNFWSRTQNRTEHEYHIWTRT